VKQGAIKCRQNALLVKKSPVPGMKYAELAFKGGALDCLVSSAANPETFSVTIDIDRK
jgi:hypothetical protein